MATIDGNTIAIRNAVWASPDTTNGVIDCEIEHPDYGWIPFTANKSDVAVYGAEIWARAAAMSPAAFMASAPTINDVAVERDRRLALGFHYNFNDARGIHLIGTTPDDMEKWREVTDSANAFINTGEGATVSIGIVTNTGPCTVTPNEWMSILKAAYNARQPFYAASFTLEASSPIPADYAADSRWPAQP